MGTAWLQNLTHQSTRIRNCRRPICGKSFRAGYRDASHQMADTRPTKISAFEAVRLTALLLLSPGKIADEEAKDNEIRKILSQSKFKKHRAHVVRSAFYSSFALVLISAVLGYGGSIFMVSLSRCAPPSTTAGLQIAGAAILLWGTLFIRGWEIQTYGGVSLTERMNQWIYRFLYCTGTVLVVYSVAFPACKY